MKVAFDINYDYSVGNLGGTRFRGQDSKKEAFKFAKDMAKIYGSVFMTKVVWNDEKKIVFQRTAIIYANGEFNLM